MARKTKTIGDDENLETADKDKPAAKSEDAQPVAAGAADKSKAPMTPTSGRKQPGVKEVIPFEWKLVGTTDGLVVTLFKAVERSEVEAQLERLGTEGRYDDLRILKIEESVSQSRTALELATPKTVSEAQLAENRARQSQRKKSTKKRTKSAAKAKKKSTSKAKSTQGKSTAKQSASTTTKRKSKAKTAQRAKATKASKPKAKSTSNEGRKKSKTKTKSKTKSKTKVKTKSKARKKSDARSR